jgi:nitrate reductase gamma subunit
MVPEILFLVALREHNRRMWWRSFPFHFGIYLVIASTVLMAVQSLLAMTFPGILSESVKSLLQIAIVVFGVSGLVLGILGALGLLHRRTVAWELREFSAPADYFNLILFVVVFGFGLVAFLLLKADFFSGVAALITNLVTFQVGPLKGGGLKEFLPLTSATLMSLLLAYIPLTHMSHFVGKYFAYHSIRWNDEPNLPGSKFEKQINEMLNRPVSWAAPHIRGEGKKTWADLATNIPDEEEK